MISPRSTLLLLATGASCVSAAIRTNMTASEFVANGQASHYTGELLSLDYYTDPAADWDLEKLHELMPVAMRLAGHAVEFTPHQYVLRGREYPAPACRRQDGSDHPQFRAGCAIHCQNKGRYCDLQSMADKGITYDRADHGHPGHKLVRESARRICIWKLYGSKDDEGGMGLYFQYHKVMKSTGCDHHLTDECVEQALESVYMNVTAINDCMGPMDPQLNEPNELMEEELMAGDETYSLPAVLVNNVEQVDFESGMPLTEVAKQSHQSVVSEKQQGHESLLEHVCRSLGNDKPHPHVCGMCLHWCPEKVGLEDFDMDTCLWDLKCGDDAGTDYHTFRQHSPSRMERYYEDFGIEMKWLQGAESDADADVPVPEETEAEILANTLPLPEVTPEEETATTEAPAEEETETEAEILANTLPPPEVTPEEEDAPAEAEVAPADASTEAEATASEAETAPEAVATPPETEPTPSDEETAPEAEPTPTETEPTPEAEINQEVSEPEPEPESEVEDSDEDEFDIVRDTIAIVLAVGVAAVALLFAVRFIRAYRTKRIIDKYVKAQKAMALIDCHDEGSSSHNSRRDPLYFPEANNGDAFDFDVESYKDHIQPATPPPPDNFERGVSA